MSTITNSLSNLRTQLRPSGAPPFRMLTLISGASLIGASLSIYYHIADVTGAVLQLGLAVSAAILLASLLAKLEQDTLGVGVGVAMLIVGISGYLLAVPAVRAELLTVEFFVEQFSYLTGISVLQFQEVDVWATGTAPGLVFLSWYLLVRHRYDAGALIGGLTLAYFVLTGDAGRVITIVGMLGLFGVLAFGSLEKHGGTWAQVERLGFALAIAVVIARLFQFVPSGQAKRIGGSGQGSADTLEISLLDAGSRVRATGSISLSSNVRFTVEADQPDYWHVASYDRYTGDGWIRTGSAEEYTEQLRSPSGSYREIVQQFTAEAPVATMPAAWKPVRVGRKAATNTSVTSLGGLEPINGWSEGETYTVISHITERSADSLRTAGTEYPETITERFLGLPDSFPDRIQELAEEITADAETPYESAVAVERWLQTNKEYSLNIERPDGDIVDGFLFDMSAGYCVYFASGMATLLRSVGIPARFAVGYSTGEPVDENKWVIRGLNSHAWVEVYFPSIGWVPFDPTPASGRQQVRETEVSEARAAGDPNVDTDETQPDQSTEQPTTDGDTTTVDEDDISGESPSQPTVVGDQGLAEQREEQLFRETTVAGPGVREGGNFTETGAGSTTDGPGEDTFSDRDRITALAGALGLTLGAHRLGLIERGYREIWLRWQPETEDPLADITRAYARLEEYLSRRHRPPHPDETPRQYLKAVSESVDERAHRVAQIYEQAHYAGEINSEKAVEAISLVDELVGSD